MNNFRFAPILLLVLTNSISFSQKKDSSAYHYFETEADFSYYLNSNCLTTEFVNMFWRGGFINTEKKDRVQDKLHYANRIGD